MKTIKDKCLLMGADWAGFPLKAAVRAHHEKKRLIAFLFTTAMGVAVAQDGVFPFVVLGDAYRDLTHTILTETKPHYRATNVVAEDISGRAVEDSIMAVYTSADADALPIVENGRSDYVIALSDDAAEAAKVREAADALQKYLRESTCAQLAIVAESATGGAPAFYLGRTKKGAAAGVPYAKLLDYVNCRKVVGKDVFLAGNDESTGAKGPLAYHDREYLSQMYGLNLHIKDLSYRRKHGTLKAVLGFLEKENVVQFLMPGENGKNIVAHKTLKIDDTLDYVGSNAFQYSNGRCYGDLHTTVALGHLDIPQYKHWGGHTFPVAVPGGRYAKTHPEYFILKDGVRRPDYGPAGGGHHCVSNPEVQDLVLATLKSQYDLGYRWIQLGPTDGQVACECEACKRLHPDPLERQWLVSKVIAEKALKLMPDAKIVILAYGFTRFAPKSFDKMPPNVIVELCIWENFEERLANWSKFKDVPKLSYVYFFGDFHSWALAPTRTPQYLAENMRALKENNVSAIFKCGWATELGLEGPISYVFSRLLEDPSRDPYALSDEFCDRAYFSTAEPMKKFFRAMYVNMDTPRGQSVIDMLKQVPQCPERMFEAAFRPDTLNYMNSLLVKAESIRQSDPKVAARLKLVRRGFDFLWMRAKCYAVQEAWTATHDESLLKLADRLYDERDRMLESWYDEKGQMRPLDGFEWPYMCNYPKEMIIRGGGQTCPCFPELFRIGKGSVKEILKKNNAVSLLERECWEGFDEFGHRLLLGDRLEDLQAAKAPPICTSDMKGVLDLSRASM